MYGATKGYLVLYVAIALLASGTVGAGMYYYKKRAAGSSSSSKGGLNTPLTDAIMEHGENVNIDDDDPQDKTGDGCTF